MRALSEIKGFGPKRHEALEKRGIVSALDLVERLPTGYRDTTHLLSPAQMTEGTAACFEGFVTGKPTLHRLRGMQWVSATIADEYGKIRCMWFNQSWMKDKLFDTQHVTLYGRAVRKKNGVIHAAYSNLCLMPCKIELKSVVSIVAKSKLMQKSNAQKNSSMRNHFPPGMIFI